MGKAEDGRSSRPGATTGTYQVILLGFCHTIQVRVITVRIHGKNSDCINEDMRLGIEMQLEHHLMKLQKDRVDWFSADNGHASIIVPILFPDGSGDIKHKKMERIEAKQNKNGKDHETIHNLHENNLQSIFNYQILMMKRSQSGSHPGQISFPGGRKNTNESPAQAARREFQEEMGIIAPSILGFVGTYFSYGSNFEVKAFVGFLPETVISQLNPNKTEVDEIILVKRKGVIDPQTYNVWGLSAKILKETIIKLRTIGLSLT